MDRGGRRNLGPLLWLTAVLGLLLTGAFFLWRLDTRRGVTNPEYSVARTDDKGAAVTYRLYQAAGLKPQVWNDDFTRLKAPGMLVLLAPGQAAGNPLSEGEGDMLPHELTALDEWVKQGNTVVVMSRADISLYEALGIYADEPKGISANPAVPIQPSVLARNVKGINTQTQFGFKFGHKPDKLREGLGAKPQASPLGAIPQSEWLTLFEKKAGETHYPQVISLARGKGLYLAVNDEFPGGNLGVTQGDDARFMLNLGRLAPAGGTIWFDEFHRRNVERGFVAYLRERALAPGLVYLLLLLGLLFWRTSFRFGAPVPLVLDERRDSAEYVKAVAALYQNAGMAREALATIYADFRRRLVGALRLDGMADLDEVGRRYEARTGRPAVEARELLMQTEAALTRPKMEEAEALQFAQRLTHLDETLHQSKGLATTRRK